MRCERARLSRLVRFGCAHFPSLLCVLCALCVRLTTAAKMNPSFEKCPNHRTLWGEALRQRSVWRRALKLGLTAGLLQGAMNQGDRWWHHTVDGVVLAKSIASPLIGFVLVLVSAGATWVQQTREQQS